jgi:dipeptidyl aminopeptidase/acylaminoacyl peptidase
MEEQDIEITEVKKSNKKIYLGLGISFAILFLGVVFFLFASKERAEVKTALPSTPVFDQEATPTPFPFQELTIPYLRARNYDSSITGMEKVSENNLYESYLASYTSDGLKINGQLTKPREEMPQGGWPAIVFVHGYIPPSQYQTFSNYSSYVDYLAREGFVVFKIDLRGHADSEGEPGGAYYSSDYIIDVLSAYSALQESDFVNHKKIGLWGHSMAGNVVFRSLASKPGIPAVVIWAGAVYSYTDWDKYGIQDGSYQPPNDDSERARKRRLLLSTYGEFDPKSSFWKQVAPTNYLSEIKGAVQLNHAIDDNVVDIGYSRDLSSLLGQAGITHDLKEYQTGGHNLAGASFNQAMQNTVNFYKNHLGN